MSSSDLPVLRWGIIATGLISSWFVEDLLLPRLDAQARHIIQAVGSSSYEKGQAFARKHCPQITPTIYPSYSQVYADPSVDIVYIGTPHAFHARNCMDAIAAGKHVLCEKAFALNAAEAHDVFAAAKERGVFVMEAMWTRFYPLMRALHNTIHKKREIGRVQRVFCDFSLDMHIAALGPDSRLKNPALGAGTLLDIGIYSLTWGLLALDPNIGRDAQNPEIVASQTLSDGVDVATAMILQYPTGAQAILTSSSSFKTSPDFCRIEGTEGCITVSGPAASAPEMFVVHSASKESTRGNIQSNPENDSASEIHRFEKLGRGFYWEADAVALDISAGRTENAVMPWEETIRVMEILDAVRRQGGATFPQDDNARE